MKLYIRHLTVFGVKFTRHIVFICINSTIVSLNIYENKRCWTNSVDSFACGQYKIHDLRHEKYMLFSGMNSY